MIEKKLEMRRTALKVPETPPAVPYDVSKSGNTVGYGWQRFIPIPAFQGVSGTGTPFPTEFPAT